MKQHLLYLRYIIIHKWNVLRACFRMRLFWQGIIHDWSKFLPCEWVPYANRFYNTHRKNDPTCTAEYEKAWLHHIHNNPHHWEHWVIPGVPPRQHNVQIFKPNAVAIPIPDKYLKEMLCDWYGAGQMQEHGMTVLEWYEVNQYDIILHPDSRKRLKELLEENTWLYY